MQAAVSTGPEPGRGHDSGAGSDGSRIELAVAQFLEAHGRRVSGAEIRREVGAAMERFRDARVRQFVSIFVTRDVCGALLGRRDRDDQPLEDA